MRREEQSIRQTGELIVMRQPIESLLFLEKLRFDLSTHRAAMLCLIDELAMACFRVGRALAQLSRLLEQCNRPARDAQGENQANGSE
jgi:hypothetical protein